MQASASKFTSLQHNFRFRHSRINFTANYDKTSLKADREVWGGGLTWNHFDFTSISLWHSSKPPQITVKTEGPGPTAPGDQRHRGNQRNPKIHRKTMDSLSIPLRTHAGSTMEAPSSRRVISFLFRKTKSSTKPKGHGQGNAPGGLMAIKSPATGSRTQEPFRFPGLSKPPTCDMRFNKKHAFSESP